MMVLQNGDLVTLSIDDGLEPSMIKHWKRPGLMRISVLRDRVGISEMNICFQPKTEPIYARLLYEVLRKRCSLQNLV